MIEILTYSLGAIMMIAGIVHFVKPRIYNPLIPKPLPKLLVNYCAGLIELLLGIGLFLPQTRPWAALGVFILMILFFPLHVWDAMRDRSVFGSKTAAWIRLPIQFVLIYWSWWIWESTVQ